MREIPLTQGQTTIIDDEDAERVMQYKWHAWYNHHGHCFYVKRGVVRNGKNCHMYLHRFLVDAVDGEEVDHANHNTLDNRRSNLRLCTRSQNVANTRKRSGATSKYKGVSWDKAAGRWVAYATLDGRQHNIGRFDNEQDAARAYDSAARRHFGDFALTNFPSSGSTSL